MAEQLRIAGRLRRGELDLPIDLDLPEGVIAVVGPNGAGKTTLLRTIAGLERITDGEVVLDGTVLDRTDPDTFVAPEHRDVAMAFQQPRLFPHLSVLRNIAYPLERSGVARTEAAARAHEIAATLGIDDLTDLRPRALSGGQAQRVNIGRALIAATNTLILDEPLAAIDAATRDELRSLFRQASARRVVWVTHDPADAEHADMVVSITGEGVGQTAS